MAFAFSMQTLRGQDGTWAALEADWRDQARRLGGDLDAYAPDSMDVLRKIAGDALPDMGGTRRKTLVAGLQANADRVFYAACMLNLAETSGTHGLTLRVRHLLESPLLGCHLVATSFHAEVLVSTLGIVADLSSSELQARQVRIHFRTRQDRSIALACHDALSRAGIDGTAELHGAWLYLARG